MENLPTVHTFAGGEIEVWLDENSVVCVKTINRYGDPVELAKHEAEELAALLVRLASEC